MTTKSAAPAEYRMSATDFDSMMRGARFELPKKKPNAKKPNKAKARQTRRAA